jgi:hypothetical protein
MGDLSFYVGIIPEICPREMEYDDLEWIHLVTEEVSCQQSNEQ